MEVPSALQLEDNKCDLSRYGDLEERFKNMRYSGSGANGCVYVAEDTHTNVEVAIKLSKKTGYLSKWEKECKDSKGIHEKACKAGTSKVKLVERYLPTCLGVGGTDDAPYMIMHAAASQGIVAARRKLPEDARKSVWAQMVGAMAAMHGIGLSHNDLHEQNVVILKRKPNAVAFIDFGEVVPLSDPRAVYRGGYKQDENLLAKEAALLANCPEEAKFPFNKKIASMEEKESRTDALFKCLQEKWCSANENCDFFPAFKDVIDEAYEHQLKRPKNIKTTKVMELYRSAFVQEHQGKLESFFPAECTDGGSAETTAAPKAPKSTTQTPKATTEATTTPETTTEATTTPKATTEATTTPEATTEATTTPKATTEATATPTATTEATTTAATTTAGPAATTTHSSAAGLQGSVLCGLLLLLLPFWVVQS